MKQREEIHISKVSPGDIVEHKGQIKTVSPGDLKYNDFMGHTLFGDSYAIGHKKVIRIKTR